MQLSFKKRRPERRRSLADLGPDEEATLKHLDLPGDLAQRLMELGFVPGTQVTVGHAAPGGDPTVFRVDGTEIALRRETARHLWIDPPNGPGTKR